MPANKDIVQNIFNETAKGNGRPFVEAMADTIVWKNPGRNSWSGTFTGKEAVMKNLLDVVRGKLANRNTIVPSRILADGDFVIVQANGANKTKDGKDYNNDYCFVLRLDGGKIVSFEEYSDTALSTEALGERI